MKYKFDDAEHLHTFEGKPLTGTSTVLEVLSKPLTWWASGEAVKTLGWTPITEYINGKPRTVAKEKRIEAVKERFVEVKSMSEVEYLDALDNAYKAHKTSLGKSAGKGKNMHAELEKYVKVCIANGGAPFFTTEDSEQFLKDFSEWSFNNVEKFIGSEVNTYSEKHWLGGIIDCIAKLKNGRYAIIDFKSSKTAYPSQFFQIGGYDIQLAESGGFTPNGEKILEPIQVESHIIIPFGAQTFEPVTVNDEKGLNRQSFLAALTLYRTIQALENNV